MNFLAHLWLADQTTTSLAGAVLGDWLHGRVPEHLPPEIRLGVSLHRRVDVMTDAHPAIVATRTQFPHGDRRYAGIVLDVVTDHLLWNRWDEFSDEKLPDFCARCGADVQANARWFDEAGGFAPTAREFELLLLSYGSAGGIRHALHRIADRMRKPEGLIAASERWPEHAELLAPRLDELLGDLSAAALAFVRRPPV